MSDHEYEVELEIVDDNPPNFVGDESSGEETAEQKAERQAKAEQDDDDKGGGSDETPSRRRNRLRNRVDELTRKYRSEERAKETIQREKEQLEQQFTDVQKQARENQAQQATWAKNTLTRHQKLLKANLKYARDRGDTDTEERLSNELVEVGTQLNQLEAAYPSKDGQQGDQGIPRANEQGQGQEQNPAQEQKPAGNAQPEIPEAGRDWIDANSFLREHKEVHQIIANHEAILRAQNEDPKSPEFYKKLNERLARDVPKEIASKLRVSFNDDLDDDDGDDDLEDTGGEEQKPAAAEKSTQTGMADGGRSAPASAAPRGKQKVKLTRDEVSYCQRNGIDPQAYAKEKAATSRQNTSGYTPIV